MPHHTNCESQCLRYLGPCAEVYTGENQRPQVQVRPRKKRCRTAAPSKFWEGWFGLSFFAFCLYTITYHFLWWTSSAQSNQRQRQMDNFKCIAQPGHRHKLKGNASTPEKKDQHRKRKGLTRRSPDDRDRVWARANAPPPKTPTHHAQTTSKQKCLGLSACTVRYLLLG